MPGQRDGAINALEHALHGAATETRKRRSAPMKKCNALTMKRVFGLQCLLSSERVPLLFTRSSLIRRADLARFSSLQVDARTRKPFLICSDNENKKTHRNGKTQIIITSMTGGGSTKPSSSVAGAAGASAGAADSTVTSFLTAEQRAALDAALASKKKGGEMMIFLF